MKNGRRLLLLALALLALAGHLAYWYLPRERTAVVDPTSPAGELLVGGEQEARAWFAFPHQNLGVAASAMDDPAGALAAATRLAGLGEVALPAFGPFALPPSRALAIAADPGGENLAVTVEVYPAVALLARVAGLLASNPVLRGGIVTASGRRVRVTWRGFAWSVREDGGAVAFPPAVRAPSAAQAPGEAGMAFLILDREQGVAEAGTYRLRRESHDLVLASSPEKGWAAVAALAEDQASREDLAFLGLRAEPRGGVSLLVQPRMAGRGLRLPDAAVAWVGDGERWSLPGERILRLLGLDPLEGRVEEWGLLAMDGPSLAVASRVAPALGEAAAEAGVSYLLWVRPSDYLPLVAAIASVLDALPIAPPDEVEHWRDLETLLRAAGPVERIRATIAAGGGEVRLGWGEH